MQLVNEIHQPIKDVHELSLKVSSLTNLVFWPLVDKNGLYFKPCLDKDYLGSELNFKLKIKILVLLKFGKLSILALTILIFTISVLKA